MSFTNDEDSTQLNRASTHDGGLYDPAVHDNQIVAMYETDAQAQAAHDTLLKHGIAASSIRIVSESSGTGTTASTSDDEGIWGAIKSMFAPDEDRTAYSHAVGRGHAMLIVTPEMGTDRQSIVQALESTDPVDFDAKLEEWRQAGYDTTAPHDEYRASMTSGMVYPRSPTIDATPSGNTAAAPAIAVAGTGAVSGESDRDTLKVIQERLRVGKRETSAGAVRIRSYVVERPVEEQVRLRQEHVSVERHAVDRAATPADMVAFQERTIEARATSEEAVVSKEARVVEEIGLQKNASERVETVRDTVRETKVDIEGDGKVTPAATDGAGTSGTNAPRR